MMATKFEKKKDLPRTGSVKQRGQQRKKPKAPTLKKIHK